MLKKRNILILMMASCSVLILAGFYRAFFVLFLEDLGWSRDTILFFVSLLTLIFLPISLLVIKKIGESKSQRNIFFGATINGILSIILGSLGSLASFSTIFIVKFGQYIGGLMYGAGRSGLFSRKLKKYPQEASALDTVFSPLCTAIGSLAAGLMIGFLGLGFNDLFIFGGLFVIVIAVLGRILMRKESPEQ